MPAFRTPALVRSALLVLFGALAATAGATQPERPGQESFLTRAVFAEGRLWLLSDAGKLSTVIEGRDDRIEETLPQKAVDLCASGGHPMVATSAGKADAAWTLRRHGEGGWSTVAVVRTQGDELLAMSCGAHAITLLTSRRLVSLHGDAQDAVALSAEPGRGQVGATYETPDQFFVGLNAGEWGGGLRRIDRRTGKLTVVEGKAGSVPCTGPLDGDCDPVNGIAAEPGKPGCIAVAVGLVHMRSHGRLLEVCGDEVRRLYFRPYGKEVAQTAGKDDEPISTVAFFGLAGDGERLTAVGVDGLYDLGKAGVVQVVPLPHFKDVGGIAVSFELPHLVLVLTNANQRHSLSGAVPLLVPR